MRIYISGRISGLTEKEYKNNFMAAHYAISEIYKNECIIFTVNPLKIKRLFKSNNWYYNMFGDIVELRKCDTIAMQPNWIDSKGAVIEFFVAKFILKLKVIYL